LLPEKTAKKIAHTFLGVGRRLSYIFPGLSYDLELVSSDLEEGEYIIVAITNALIWAFLLFLLLFGLSYSKGTITSEQIRTGFSSLREFQYFLTSLRWFFLSSAIVFIVFLSFFMYYPRILARKIVENVDKDLIYALKDLLLQISAGVSLFDAMVNISKSGYGKISKEFKTAVQDINAGEMQEIALEKMALRTESEFLRRTVRQILVAFKSGASLQVALKSVIRNLQQYQRSQIKSYTYELNLWVLLYIIVAVAIPSLGVTLLVILSTFGGVSVNEGFVVNLMVLSFMGEIVLIELIKTRRPVLHV
jgi:flagellar protein FlaJ